MMHVLRRALRRLALLWVFTALMTLMCIHEYPTFKFKTSERAYSLDADGRLIAGHKTIDVPVLLFLGGFWTMALYVFCLVLWNIRAEYKVGPLPGSARAFIDREEFEHAPYSLILRPFGADHTIDVLGESEVLSVEDIIDRVSARQLGCPTVALVDPKRSLTPKALIYIASDDTTWRDCVEDLVRNARLIVLVVPPGHVLGNNVQWELDRVRAHSLDSRLILVLPFPDSWGYARAYQSLRSLRHDFPGVAQVPYGAFVVRLTASGEWWAHTLPLSPLGPYAGKFAFARDLDAALTAGIRQCFEPNVEHHSGLHPASDA